MGLALVFPLGSDGVDLQRKDATDVQTELNLYDTKYELDLQPPLPGCECFTCKRHTRAYIHHLLNTHEMLAHVLLTL